MSEPDVLLLDEPTNHLDVSAVEWLEQYVIDHAITLVFVTHDRAFLRRVATRIVDLDRGKLVDWGAGYDAYLEKKNTPPSPTKWKWALFDKKLAQEEVWIRTGIQETHAQRGPRLVLEALRLEVGRAPRKGDRQRQLAKLTRRTARGGWSSRPAMFCSRTASERS